jgi:tRNA threonylcarbamoyladenosine biosynthesis protein TsaE
MVNSALPRLSIECRGLEQLGAAASKIIKFAGGMRFWIFEGDMGAGKTTLIKEICKQLNVGDVVTSPTYSIINEYQNSAGDPIYHFDFYRLNDESEAYDIGADEYFDSGEYCLIEWPSKVPTLLPESNFLTVSIKLAHEDFRLIELTRHD